jgi:serine/threonine protein kinase
MVTGYRPFQGDSATTVCFKVVNRDPIPITSFDAGFPTELETIITRVMAKDPAERFQSGAEMAEVIAQFRKNRHFTANGELPTSATSLMLRTFSGNGVENHAEREQIGARVHTRPAELFRRHVCRTTQQLSAYRELCQVQLGDAEVRDFGVPPGSHKNVGGLDVAVNHAIRVRAIWDWCRWRNPAGTGDAWGISPNRAVRAC